MNGLDRGYPAAPSMSMQPFYFSAQERRLFAAMHPASGSTRALVLMCPPLLHEHMRSYRFFAQLAGRLAAGGVACLRFDYYGTGDSEGDDADFSPDLALSDIACAADELRARAGGHPLVLMGIRASAPLAFHAAAPAGADALWLWQPICDGCAHAQALEAQDRAARSERDRYPLRPLPVPAADDSLMGFRTSPGFRAELSARCVVAGGTELPVAVITDANSVPPAFANGVHHVLPDAATDWAGEIDMRSVIHVRDAEAVVQALLQDLPQRMPRTANG